MSLNPSAIITLKEAITTLDDQLHELKKIVRNRYGPAWFPGIGPVADGVHSPQRTQASKSLTQLHNEQGWTPLEAGIVYCPPEAANLIAEINEQKAHVKEIIKELRQGETKGSTIATMAAGYQGQDPNVNEALARLNLPRLNLLWAYRQIHLLPQGLSTVSWLWTRPNAIKRVSVKEALEMAENLDERAREYAIRVLASISPSQPLAYVKPVSEHLRVNISWIPKGEKNLKRRMMTPSTVMLFQDSELPRIRWPVRGEKSTRLPRRDRKIERDPIIKSLRLHCYMEGANG